MGTPDLGAAAAQAGLSGRFLPPTPAFRGRPWWFFGRREEAAMRVTPTLAPSGQRRARADCGARASTRSRNQIERADRTGFADRAEASAI